MQTVITPDRAIGDGISPSSLISVAEWHEERAATIERALGGKKKRAFGGPVSFHDQRRHEQMAADIRQVAKAMTRLAKLPAAA